MHGVVAPEGSGTLPTLAGEGFHDLQRHIRFDRPSVAEGIVIGVEVDRRTPAMHGVARATALGAEIVDAAVVLGLLQNLALPEASDLRQDALEGSGDFEVAAGFSDPLAIVKHGVGELDRDQVRLIPWGTIELP